MISCNRLRRTIDYENTTVEGVIRFTAPLQLGAKLTRSDVCGVYISYILGRDVRN